MVANNLFDPLAFNSFIRKKAKEGFPHAFGLGCSCGFDCSGGIG